MTTKLTVKRKQGAYWVRIRGATKPTVGLWDGVQWDIADVKYGSCLVAVLSDRLEDR